MRSSASSLVVAGFGAKAHILEAVEQELVALVSRRGLGRVAVEATTQIFEIEGFDSLAVAEFIEDLETLLRFEFPPEMLVPETFMTPLAAANVVAWCLGQKQVES